MAVLLGHSLKNGPGHQNVSPYRSDPATNLARMRSSDTSTDKPVASGAWFTTTHWSVIWTARDRASSGAARALEKLCRAYWPPVYTYIRRKGYRVEDAEDLTQEFFRQLIEKNHLDLLVHQDGKFRCFLLTLLKDF